MLSRENSTSAEAKNEASSSSSIKDKLSANEDRFKFGVIIRAKFIGVEDVKEDHGDEICRISMIKLKALVLAKKEHKQRICVRVSLDGVELLDERTNTPIFSHPVKKISYIARDPDDSRAIGYIFKNSPNSYQYFAIKTIGQAQELFNTLKELFEVVLEMRTRAKKLEAEQAAAAAAGEGTAGTGEKSSATAAEDASKDQEIQGLADTIKKMNEQPEPVPTAEPTPAAAATASLLDVTSDPNNLVSSFEDSLNLAPSSPTPDPTTTTTAAANNKSSDELFSLMDPATNAPSPQDNQLTLLKAQISSIQTFSVPPPRMAPAAPTSPMMQNPMMNPFGVATASAVTPQPGMVQNPFGNTGVAMGVPLTQFSSPMQAGVGGGFMGSPSPNVFSSQIPNPQAAVNPNPSTSQMPW